MTEHTPTPWAHREGVLHEASDKWKCLPINSPYVEGAFESGKDGHDVAAANAAYIVKCCNAFPDLVKALEKARARIEYLGAACIDPKHFEANASTFLPAIDEVLGRVKGAPDHG